MTFIFRITSPYHDNFQAAFQIGATFTLNYTYFGFVVDHDQVDFCTDSMAFSVKILEINTAFRLY